MTPNELKAIRNKIYCPINKKLALTQQGLAHWINPHAKHMSREIRRWESGENTIPGYIETIVLMFDIGYVPVHIQHEARGFVVKIFQGKKVLRTECDL